MSSVPRRIAPVRPAVPSFSWLRSRIVLAATACALPLATAFALEPPPVVTGITPTTVPAVGGVLLTVTGSNFVRAHGTCMVGLGTNGARRIDPQTVLPTQLTFLCPASFFGPDVPVVVEAPDGQRSAPVLVDGAPPALVSISANSTPHSGGTLITLTGNNFSAAYPVVDFSGVPMHAVRASDTEIVVNTPPNTTGVPFGVSVQARGYTSGSLPLTAVGPRIDDVTPAMVARHGGTVITIHGAGFSGSARVSVGGSEAEVTFTSPTEVHATAPPQNLKAVAVELKTSERSNPFTIGVDNTPVIDYVWPSAGRAAGGTSITIAGHNFGPSPLVTIGGAPAVTTPISSSKLSCVTPPGSGTATMSVLNEDGLAGDTAFEYLDPPAILTLSPGSIPADGGTVLTLSGAHFGPNDDNVRRSAEIDGVPFPVRWTAPEVLEVRAPPGSGPSSVVVIVIDDVASPPRVAPRIAPGAVARPTITSLTPPTAPVAGGTVLTISGSNFGGALAPATVWFGSRPVTPTVNTGTTILCTTPTCPPAQIDVNAVSITVIGLSSPPSSLPTSVPTISSVSPATSSLAGGVRLTVQGSNFGDAARMRVSFGGILAPVQSVISSGELRCILPPRSSAGPLSVEVISVDGLASSPSSVTCSGPDLVSVTPSLLPAGGGVITIVGSNFGAISGAMILGNQAADVLDWSDTQVRAGIPLRTDTALGYVLLSSSTGVRSDAVEMSWSPPSLSSMSPPEGRASGGTRLTIAGSNFTPSTMAVMSGLPLEVDDRQAGSVVCRTPPGGSGEAEVQLVDFGTVTPSAPFTLLDPPSIDHVTPSSGPLAGGTVLTVMGANFPSSASSRLWVSLGDMPAVPATAVSSTECRVLTDPSSVSGPVSVTVSVDDVPDTQPDGFTYGTAGDVPPGPKPVAFAFSAGPNPFAAALSFRIALPIASDWRLSIHDATGALVRRYQGRGEPGETALRWDGRRADGSRAAPGLYLARLEAGDRKAVRRVAKLE